MQQKDSLDIKGSLRNHTGKNGLSKRDIIFFAFLSLEFVRIYFLPLFYCSPYREAFKKSEYLLDAVCLYIPVSFGTALLDTLAFGSPLTAHTVSSSRSCHPQRLKAFGRLFKREFNSFPLSQTSETFHVKFTLKELEKDMNVWEIESLVHRAATYYESNR